MLLSSSSSPIPSVPVSTAVVEPASTSKASLSVAEFAPSTTLTPTVQDHQLLAVVGSILAIVAIAFVAHMLAICVVSAVLYVREKREMFLGEAHTATYYKYSGELLVCT